MEKLWQVKPRKYDDVIKQLLYNRGITEGKEQESFLEPDFERDFFDPKKLPDFSLAITRIAKAIDCKDKIGIFADYDADGIPGAALFKKALDALSCPSEIYIPTRHAGYGFNQSGIDFLIESGCKLIVSIDIGIKEIKFAKYLKSKKIDLIITDHHEPGIELPEALAVVNPKRGNSKYPFRELCGAGVVYKIIQGLTEKYPKILDEKFLKWNLDLVAISTICDVVPLTSENRLIAKFGLKVLAKTQNLGLKEIYHLAKIESEKIDAYIVGFQIGPRINAPGRLDHATGSYKILTTKDKNEARELALHLEEQNTKRQESMDEIFDAASRIIDRESLAKNKIIILANKNWAKGVIGPVASRLVEKYTRPVIMFYQSEEKLEGSCRSIPGFNITEALDKVANIVESYGGHAGAAGVRLKKSHFQKFQQILIDYANKNISEEDIRPKINIDLELKKDKINLGLFKKLEQFEPFGLGNPRPVFLSRRLQLTSHRLVGRENKHLQLRFRLGNKEIKGIVFNHQFEVKDLKISDSYDLVYIPKVDFWNGSHYIDLQIQDFRKSETSDSN